jgi:hypothetical protein
VDLGRAGRSRIEVKVDSAWISSEDG